ncbi:GAP family protein [Paenibacillus camelliae]|uniref:GAP family protein n=1 Tax=Paenibacillus camelliae TaxID=512410 RepID=UPI00203BC057|nr:GAP family protein [Paenibacillus camelliae]MCM3635751.1 GAP family protein [Paenibacillus camelliae]
MLEIIESLIPANIDFTTALLIIALCAFIDILSPGVLAITAYILLIQKEKLTSRLIIFLLSTQICYFMLGILVYLGVGSILGFIESTSNNQISSWFYTILGAILVLISFYKPKKRMESRFWEWLPKQVSIRAMIVLGIIVFAIEFTTALPYFYSILLMDGLAFNTGLSIITLLGYNVLMVLPSILLLIIYILFRSWIQNKLEKLRTKLLKAPLSSVLVGVAVIGAVLFNIGIRGIL